MASIHLSARHQFLAQNLHRRGQPFLTQMKLYSQIRRTGLPLYLIPLIFLSFSEDTGQAEILENANH